MEISHPWHEHPLFLSDESNFDDHCSICEKVFEGEPFYACVDCRYYLHKSCAELPVEIQHHFHPPHTLQLTLGSDFICDSCHKRFRNELRFRCSTCDFDLDVKCATMSDINAEGKEFIRHFTHQHQLTICSKDGDNPLTCFACKKTSSDLIYGCTPCDYFLHKSCSELPTHVLHATHPHHALSLVVKFGRCTYCQLCGHTWHYLCTLCDIYLDVSCLIESAKDAQNLETSCFLCGKLHLNSDSCINLLYLIDHSCIQLPEKIEHGFHSHKPLLLVGAQDFECDSCHKWFDNRSHYGCEDCNFRMDVKCTLMGSIGHENGDQPIWPVVPPHFNHQHPLRLIGEVYDINCFACNTTNASPIYGCCIKCDYFLHQSCLELPIQFNHPLHDSHVLSLQPLRDNFCRICRRKYDGFGFGCIQCDFFIGIECIFALVSSVIIVHKYHDHLLYLIQKPNCDRCDSNNTFCQFLEQSIEFEFTKSYSLRCIECDYNLHLLCGPLPCFIKHRSHLHVLTLEDSIVEDDSDEYYCDICEEIRNPRLCVYYCEDCQFFAHIHCVISEIINIFDKNSQRVDYKIVGDLRLGDYVNPSYNNFFDNFLTGTLVNLLVALRPSDMKYFKHSFPDGRLFPRKEDRWETLKQKSSSEDKSRNIIEELSFYNDDIFLNIEKRLKSFKPDIQYHIDFDECKLPIIQVDSYKVTSDFAPLSRALLMKYDDFFHISTLSNNGKSVLLYFLCRTVNDMRRTYIGDITEKQLFTWHYYIRPILNIGQLQFFKPFLDMITRSYFGLRAIKFEDEAIGRLDGEIVKVEQKIFELEIKREELKGYRQQHRPGKIVEESKVMKQLVGEAKLLKHKRAGECIV